MVRGEVCGSMWGCKFDGVFFFPFRGHGWIRENVNLATINCKSTYEWNTFFFFSCRSIWYLYIPTCVKMVDDQTCSNLESHVTQDNFCAFFFEVAFSGTRFPPGITKAGLQQIPQQGQAFGWNFRRADALWGLPQSAFGRSCFFWLWGEFTEGYLWTQLIRNMSFSKHLCDDLPHNVLFFLQIFHQKRS